MSQPPNSKSKQIFKSEKTSQSMQDSGDRTQYDDPLGSDFDNAFGVESSYQVSRQQEHANDSAYRNQGAMTTYNHITYLLYVISYFTAGLLWVVPIVMNYAKRQDADGTWLATHFDWQIKTFWYSIVWFAIGLFIILFALGGLGVSAMMVDSTNLAIGSVVMTGFGLMIIVFTLVWHFYRIVRGWIALTDNRPVP